MIQAFRDAAKSFDKIDREVYAAHGRDPLEPIIGEGPADARLAIFGRDPGRDEVKHQMPFIGAGGQKVRAMMHDIIEGKPMPDFEASVAIGHHFFWANTVPYKPIGNKAWSQKVKKAVFPIMAQVLLEGWQGQDVITLGREAFLWFGLGHDKAGRDALMAFWQQDDRFETSLNWQLTAPNGMQRNLRLHPLPHPSPLNATWYKRFPGLLEARLRKFF